jgi:hypothetical protein
LNGKLFSFARTLLRSQEERTRPNHERLREYFDSNKGSLELALFSEAPVHSDFDQVKLEDGFLFMCEVLGSSNRLVQIILQNRSPKEAAAALVAGTKLSDPKERRRLYQLSSELFELEKDSFLELARAVDTEARALRKHVETQNERKEVAYAQIAKLRYRAFGSDLYPDATSTLRLAFGTVKGYQEIFQEIEPFTTFSGLYQRALENRFRPPFHLSETWLKAERKLKLETPFNFVATADIIGGNSGSPVVNRNGEYLGIIFDGNIQSLPWDYSFDDKAARSVIVDARAIIHALDKVYKAKDLLKELGFKR